MNQTLNIFKQVKEKHNKIEKSDLKTRASKKKEQNKFVTNM